MSENLRLAETTSVPAFEECIKDESVKYTLDNLEVLQINVGRLCNLACKHCHVEAGPARIEVMSRETLEACLQLYKEWGFKTVDITGGAPEMNPHFEWFVDEVTKVCDHVIVRSNLVIMKEENMHIFHSSWQIARWRLWHHFLIIVRKRQIDSVAMVCLTGLLKSCRN